MTKRISDPTVVFVLIYHWSQGRKVAKSQSAQKQPPTPVEAATLENKRTTNLAVSAEHGAFVGLKQRYSS